MPNPVFTYILNIWYAYLSCRYTLINDQAVVSVTIPFSISHLFAFSLNDQTVLFDPLG